MHNKIPLRFFIFTFMWSWLFWGILIIFGQGITQEMHFPIMLLGAFGPAVGALASTYTTQEKGSLKKFIKQFLSLKFGWKAWLAIFIVPCISGIIAWIIPEFFGEDRLPPLLPNIFIFPAYIILMVFLGGGQEEIGWQGYIMPKLEKRYGLIIAGFILGIVWAVWHLPLWFVAGATQNYMNFFGFMLLTIGKAFFFSWVIKVSGERLFSGLAAHGVANSFVVLFPWLVLEENAIQTRFWIYCFLTFVIGMVIVMARACKSRKPAHNKR